MTRYRKPRAHIGSNDPEQVKRWAEAFPDCNWGIEIDRSCITVVDLTHGRKPPTAHGRSPAIVTATGGGTHHFYQTPDRDPIKDEPEIMTAKVGPASAAGDADSAWFWLNVDQTLRVRRATPNERNIEKGITVTIVRTLGPGMRIREFWMVPESLVGYVLKYGERCLVDDGSGIVMPGSNVNGEILAWSENGGT
jgi:Bifunctional DNA primase/polymerase, N-terminal